MKRTAARPLLWLAALLAVYLCAPFVASVPQLGAADWANVDWRATWSAVGVSAASASVASLVILLGGVPLGYFLARSNSRKVAALGAGEILLTSMDRDGTKSGFDLGLTRAVSDAVPIPVIASGGVGTLQHLADGVTDGHADAVLAASIFHYGEHTVGEAKRFMADQGISVRI